MSEATSPSGASVWNEFFSRHAAQRKNFTPVFNAFLEAVIDDKRLPLSLRVVAWVLRHSWGNHSDATVNSDSVIVRQSDCARDLGVDRKAVSPAFIELRKQGYIARESEGGAIVVLDDPRGIFAKSSPPAGLDSADIKERAKDDPFYYFDAYLERVVGPLYPVAFQAYTQSVQHVKAFRTEHLPAWKEFRATCEPSRNGSDKSSERNGHHVQKEPTSPPRNLITESKESLKVSTCAPGSGPSRQNERTQTPPERRATARQTPSIVVQHIAEKFEPIESPAIAAEWDQFAAEQQTEHGLPINALLIAIDDKIAEKQQKRYRIDGPRALLHMVRNGIGRWRRENRVLMARLLRDEQQAQFDETPEQAIDRLEGYLRSHPNHVQVPEWEAEVAELRRHAKGTGA